MKNNRGVGNIPTPQRLPTSPEPGVQQSASVQPNKAPFRKGTLHAKHILWALLATFLWGCAFPAVKKGYELFQIQAGDVSGQMLFAGIRFFAAGLVTLLVFWLSHRQPPIPQKNQLSGILLMGLIQTGAQYFFFYVGLAHTTGVRGSIFNTTSTFMTVLLVGVLWRKTDGLTIRKLLGCGLGVSGAVLINLSGSVAAPFTLLGDGFVLLSALMMAIGAVLTKIFAQKTDPMLMTGWQLSFGGALLLGIGLALGGTLGQVTGQGLLLLGFMVGISTVSFTLWTYLLKENPVSSIMIFQSLIPVFGVTLSGMVLGEQFLSPAALVALALVCLGIFTVNFKKQAR